MILLVIQTEKSATSSLSDPLLMRVPPHTVLGAEMILESYAEVYSIINSRLEIAYSS